ncbi:MAG: serine hydrolase domain-containing protein [Actinomycetota bacterium]
MDEQQLREWVSEAAERLQVPGVAVGVLHEGAERYAFHGVTSIENPLPVDETTLFQFGSTGKTFTATAILRLVEQGELDLDERVRTYVPELRLKDESVAEKVTLMHLLNHTAGWSGDLIENTGFGDDALARYVEKMAEIEQVTPLGATVSYNNASLSLAGRIIEKVTGKTFEQAMKELIFEPLGLSNSFFFPNDIMTRRFVAGHTQKNDGTIVVARPWALGRGGWPAGGISSNAADQIAWARFHLGDGRAPDGTRILSEETLKRMQQPTAEAAGSAIGDAIGISWMIRDVEGIRLVGHGGNTIGQDSGFDMVPERGFALITMTNSSPNGSQFNEELLRWALEAYLGVIEKDPEPISLGDSELARYAGTYETIAVDVELVPQGGQLLIHVHVKPETIEQLVASCEELEQPEPIPIGLLPGDGDRYIVTDGPAKGMRGYFVRGPEGEVEGIHVGGRFATKAKAPVTTS